MSEIRIQSKVIERSKNVTFTAVLDKKIQVEVFMSRKLFEEIGGSNNNNPNKILSGNLWTFECLVEDKINEMERAGTAIPAELEIDAEDIRRYFQNENFTDR
ncbi:hypothetical protein KKG72_07615 [bacterium]|nr:hypothetical protein [bacterium]MBU1994114.1 hypothetical protein [bacterium]